MRHPKMQPSIRWSVTPSRRRLLRGDEMGDYVALMLQELFNVYVKCNPRNLKDNKQPVHLHHKKNPQRHLSISTVQLFYVWTS